MNPDTKAAIERAVQEITDAIFDRTLSGKKAESILLKHFSERGEADAKRLIELLEMIPTSNSFGGAGEAWGILHQLAIKASKFRAAMKGEK